MALGKCSNMVQIKLRMQDGDVGPLQQTNSDTVGDLKSRLVSDWAKLHAGARLHPIARVYAASSHLNGFAVEKHVLPYIIPFVFVHQVVHPRSTIFDQQVIGLQRLPCCSAGRTGPLQDAPPSIAEVKLILNGKFLDNDMSLGGETKIP